MTSFLKCKDYRLYLQLLSSYSLKKIHSLAVKMIASVCLYLYVLLIQMMLQTVDIAEVIGGLMDLPVPCSH